MDLSLHMYIATTQSTSLALRSRSLTTTLVFTQTYLSALFHTLIHSKQIHFCDSSLLIAPLYIYDGH